MLMNDSKLLARDLAAEQEKRERAKKPDYAIALAGTLLWVLAVAVALLADAAALAVVVLVAAALLVVAGAFWRPLRSGLTPQWTALVPLWGLIARWDRVRTCTRLRTAGIYTDKNPRRTIPATTYRRAGDTFVQFDGHGQAGMDPATIDAILEKQARVWSSRSYAVSEDPDRPGRFTLQLSKADHIRTALDSAITGVVDPPRLPHVTLTDDETGEQFSPFEVD